MSILTKAYQHSKPFRRWVDRMSAEVATEPPCKSRFRNEKLLPKGKALWRTLLAFAAVVAGWIVLMHVWPDGEAQLRTILTIAMAATAMGVGRASGWLEGARETYAWTHGEERKREDNPLDRDPDLWMTTGSVNDRS